MKEGDKLVSPVLGPEAELVDENSTVSPSSGSKPSVCLSSDSSAVATLLEAMDRNAERSKEAQNHVIEPEPNEDLSKEGSSKDTDAHVNLSQVGQDPMELHSEPSGSSVSRILLQAMSDTQEVCSNFWWGNLRIPRVVASQVIGKGTKRHAKALKNPTKPKKPKISIDLCEAMFSLEIGTVTTTKPKVVNVDTIAEALESLYLCECMALDCFTCNSRNLMSIGDVYNADCVMNSETSAVSQVGLCENENTMGNSSSQCHQESQESHSDQMQQSSGVSGIGVPQTEPIEFGTKNNHFYVSAQPSTAVGSGLGGQCLPNGRPLASQSCIKVGRFLVKTWCEVSGPIFEDLRPGHRSQRPTLTVSTFFPRTKSLNLKGITPLTQIKRTTLVKKRPRRMPKQSLAGASLAPTDRRSRLVQRGIQAFFKKQDGPMGVEHHGILDM